MFTHMIKKLLVSIMCIYRVSYPVLDCLLKKSHLNLFEIQTGIVQEEINVIQIRLPVIKKSLTERVGKQEPLK